MFLLFLSLFLVVADDFVAPSEQLVGAKLLQKEEHAEFIRHHFELDSKEKL